MSEQMLTVVAQMKSKKGKEAALKEALLALLEPTRKEDGCINYDMHQSGDNPGSFLFHENWTNKSALDRHLEAPHMKDFFRKVPKLIDGDVQISLWKPVHL